MMATKEPQLFPDILPIAPISRPLDKQALFHSGSAVEKRVGAKSPSCRGTKFDQVIDSQ